MTAQPAGAAEAARDADVTWATLGYLGAVFLGPLIPLAVWLARRNRSGFMRYHAAMALNLSLTAALYGLCSMILGGLLALDTVTVALVVGLGLLFALWLLMLKYLIRGVSAAHRNETFEIPSWLCATMVDHASQGAGAGVNG